MDDEEPECNGPDCGHAGTCRYYKGLMEEDDFFVKLLEEYNRKKELLLMSRQVGSKAHSAFMRLVSK